MTRTTMADSSNNNATAASAATNSKASDNSADTSTQAPRKLGPVDPNMAKKRAFTFRDVIPKSSTYWGRQQRLEPCNQPYAIKSGLGIRLADRHVKVLADPRTGDSARFNLKNPVGRVVVNMTMKSMRAEREEFLKSKAENQVVEVEEDEDDGAEEIEEVEEEESEHSEEDQKPKKKKKTNSVAEDKHFKKVIKEFSGHLQELGRYDPDLPEDRLCKTLKPLFCGFNTDGDRNTELDKLLIIYVQIRAGEIPHDGDEMQAAYQAAQVYHMARPVKNQYSPTTSLWAISAVHLLNQHLIEYHLPPITMAVDGDEDDNLCRPERIQNSKKIWVLKKVRVNRTKKSRSVKVRALVESRKEVLDTLIKYCAEELHTTITPNLGDSEDEPNTQPKSKRRRRSLY